MTSPVEQQYTQGCSTDEAMIQKSPKRKTPNGLIVNELPPPPKDICFICDPIMENELRLAIFSTIFCWLLLGVVPVVFGLLSIHYALEARKSKDPEKRLQYSRLSSNISWIGMMLFTAAITVAVVIIATCGVL